MGFRGGKNGFHSLGGHYGRDIWNARKVYESGLKEEITTKLRGWGPKGANS